MKKLLLAVALLQALTLFAQLTPKPPVGTRKIQVAILLDASGSMQGLINQARTQLWHMLQVLGKAHCPEGQPSIEIALYAYGESAPSPTYMRQVLPFTNSLDTLSAALFQFSTTGSEEYCGLVLHRSISELKWDPAPGSYKALFIAGNESFGQGPYAAATACSEAIKQGIIINTVFCGDALAPDASGWRLLCGNGSFHSISADSRIEEQATPYDSALFVWNNALNKTFVPYGQPAADTTPQIDVNDPSKIVSYRINVDSLNFSFGNAAGLDRIAVKGDARLDRNDAWDLVDAETASPGFIRKLPRARLPATLREKSFQEIETLVAEKKAERAQVRTQILALSTERTEWLSKENAKNQKLRGETLQSALERSLRKQLLRCGFTLE